MPLTMEQRLVLLREQILVDRQRELARAIACRTEPAMAAYHTGLADGRNQIVHSIERILTGGCSAWLSK